MGFKLGDIDESQAPLLDHLIELRARLIRSIVALSLAFGLCLYHASAIFGILIRPLTKAFPPGQGKLVYTKLYEAFFVEIKVALFAAFFLSFPVIANQLWAFVAPGLYAREKKAFLPFLIATPVLFGLGAAMAYFLVMPNAFKWLLGFQGQSGGLNIEALPAAGDYLGLVMQFIFAFGLSFLLPVLLLLLNRAGIVSRQHLISLRRYVIVALTGVAAVITPPDLFSQILLLVPLLLLFEGSLLIMWLGERRAVNRPVEETASRPAPLAPAPLENDLSGPV